MHVTYRWFDGVNDDRPGHEVIFESDRFPGVLILRFHLLPRGDRDPEPVNVGVELRQTRPSGPVHDAAVTAESTFEIPELVGGRSRRTAADRSTEPVPIDPGALDRIALDYQRYLDIAHSVMRMQAPWPSDDERKVMVQRARRKGRGRRGLDRGFFELLATEVRERRERGETAIATAIAEAHGVDRSTASRWLKRLETEGHLAEGNG